MDLILFYFLLFLFQTFDLIMATLSKSQQNQSHRIPTIVVFNEA